MHNNTNKVAKTQYPEYFNFAGDYVFSVPKNYGVDDQAIPGKAIVYSQALTAQSEEDIYNSNDISLVAITGLSDHSGKTFKDYAKGTFLADAKKSLATNDIQLKFGKTGGQDVARAVVNKDGKAFRFIYLKNGQHPVALMSKDETDGFKRIEQTLVDIETSDLKSEAQAIKDSIKNNIQLAKDQKSAELYNASAPEFKAKNTQDELTKALQKSAPYTGGNITISGGRYAPNEFTAAIRFVKLDKNDQQPALGSMVLKKIDGQWKLVLISLPPPKQ